MRKKVSTYRVTADEIVGAVGYRLSLIDSAHGLDDWTVSSRQDACGCHIDGVLSVGSSCHFVCMEVAADIYRAHMEAMKPAGPEARGEGLEWRDELELGGKEDRQDLIKGHIDVICWPDVIARPIYFGEWQDKEAIV